MPLSEFPRVELCHRMTPIELMPRLTEALGGPKLWVKRDDCTGLAGGGNKTRKLEFLVAEALEQGADTLVTQGAVQSNHVRQTAAAACKVGLRCAVLLERRVPERREDYEVTGNVLLDALFGAEVEFRPPDLDMNAEAVAFGEKLQAEGRKPYVIPGGGSNTTGAIGYAGCALEIAQQSREMDVKFDWVVHATGSTGTQAGLVAGFAMPSAAPVIPVLGISVRQPRAKQEAAVHKLADATARRLGVAAGVSEDSVHANSDYVGVGYGIPTAGTIDAIKMLAQLEGLLLDPVYSAKGMDGFINLIRDGYFSEAKNLLFIHTGGAQVLPAYDQELSA
jgi:L-cysteate sulfo-lyase